MNAYSDDKQLLYDYDIMCKNVYDVTITPCLLDFSCPRE